MKQIEFLRFVIDALEKLNISYAVVGSYASSAWDITGILKIRKEPLDLDYITSTARQLRLLDVWQSIVEKLK